MRTLYVREPSGAFTEATRVQIITAARSQAVLRKGMPVLSDPGRVREALQARIGNLEHEVFGALYLDARHRLIECVELFRGTIDGASVHPREVVKEALLRNAAALVLFHNHPSGTEEPSRADELITHRLRDALALLEIRIIDHLIVTADASMSFAERGLL